MTRHTTAKAYGASRREDLPHDVYMQVRYIIKGYDRLRKKKAALLYGSPLPAEGMPRSGRTGNPTERSAVMLVQVGAQLAAIEQAVSVMRGQYSGKMEEDWNVLDAYWSYEYFNYKSLRYGEEDLGPCKRTWCYFKNRLSAEVAGQLHIY